MIEFLVALSIMFRSIAILTCEFETACIAHEMAVLLARWTFMFLFFVSALSLMLAGLFFGAVGRVFGLEMGIHIPNLLTFIC